MDTIERSNGIPVKYIRADVAPGVLADTKVKEIQSWLDEQTFDPRLSIQFRGTNEEQQDAMAFVSIAFSLSLLLMFLLLVTQFNSFYQSVLILFAVVLSTAGVLLGLLVTGNPFSAISLRRGHRGAGGHCGEQQHRAHRHLQPSASGTPGTQTIFPSSCAPARNACGR